MIVGRKLSNLKAPTKIASLIFETAIEYYKQLLKKVETPTFLCIVSTTEEEFKNKIIFEEPKFAKKLIEEITKLEPETKIQIDDESHQYDGIIIEKLTHLI